jgi:hypothetical protein
LGESADNHHRQKTERAENEWLHDSVQSKSSWDFDAMVARNSAASQAGIYSSH